MRLAFTSTALCLAILLGGFLAAAQPALAQSADGSGLMSENPYGTGAGVEILLTNSGFGIGGYYHRAVTSNTSFMAELNIGAGKDERELKFFRFGSSYIPNKANYLLMLPVQIGFVRRLFQESIEENFRPYVQFTGGPTLGWEYPYFDDEDGDGTYEPFDGERSYDALSSLHRGSFRLGTGGTVAIGAHFGLSKKVTQGVRLGYAFTYFFEGIQLLEPDAQEKPQHFFGTPTISLTFGKLF